MQRQKVLEKGIFLFCRETRETAVFLFQIDGFYIEVYFKHDNDELYSIRSFDGTDFLEPYLEKIDLQQLMKECLKN